jgi:Flp pilus assembly protein TadG
MVVVSPLLILMVLGVADFGRILYTSIVIAHAARAGAAYGVQSSGFAANATGIRNAARAEATDIGAITVTSFRTCGCPTVADTQAACDSLASCPSGYGAPIVYVNVTTSWPFTTLTPWPGIPSSTTLSYTAKVRLQ